MLSLNRPPLGFPFFPAALPPNLLSFFLSFPSISSAVLSEPSFQAPFSFSVTVLFVVLQRVIIAAAVVFYKVSFMAISFRHPILISVFLSIHLTLFIFPKPAN